MDQSNLSNWYVDRNKPRAPGVYPVQVHPTSPPSKTAAWFSRWSGEHWCMLSTDPNMAAMYRQKTAHKLLSFKARAEDVVGFNSTGPQQLAAEHVTDWIDGKPAATRPGVYEVRVSRGARDNVEMFSWWDGQAFRGMFVAAEGAHRHGETAYRVIASEWPVIAHRGATVEGALCASPPSLSKNFPCKPLVLDTSMISKVELDKLRASLRELGSQSSRIEILEDGSALVHAPGGVTMAGTVDIRTPSAFTEIREPATRTVRLTVGGGGTGGGGGTTFRTPPADTRPRWVAESWADATKRVPALAFRGLGREPLRAETAAEVMNLADSLPGYQLMQIHNPPARAAVLLFRRTAEARNG